MVLCLVLLRFQASQEGHKGKMEIKIVFSLLMEGKLENIVYVFRKTNTPVPSFKIRHQACSRREFWIPPKPLVAGFFMHSKILTSQNFLPKVKKGVEMGY